MKDFSPWAEAALRPELPGTLQSLARAAGGRLNAVGGGARGPWTVRVWGRERVVELRGIDLEALCFEAIERFGAGADTNAAQWRAGSDGLAHGHASGRVTWALCQRPAVDERFSYPERARCTACVRTLDRVAA